MCICVFWTGSGILTPKHQIRTARGEIRFQKFLEAGLVLHSRLKPWSIPTPCKVACRFYEVFSQMGWSAHSFSRSKGHSRPPILRYLVNMLTLGLEMGRTKA